MKLKVRYSLRFFLLAFTVLAIWLGIRTNAALNQRRAVAIINEAEGDIYFNWQMKPVYDAQGNMRHWDIIKDPNVISAPAWLRQLIGDEFFQKVECVDIHPDLVNDEVIAAMRRLPKLKRISLDWDQLGFDDTMPRPDMTREELEELKQRIGQQCPNASVWSPGL